MSAGLREASVLLVGAGGLGSPVAELLVRAGVSALTVLDDDAVDRSNLHRQTLYRDADEGHPKATAAATHLRALAKTIDSTTSIVAREMRILPDTALETLKSHDLVVEGADNFATKFLLADACAISKTPLVQAGAVQWVGWALASVPGASACLRCVFEDIPGGDPPSCATAGVIGPVVGAVGALQAALAIRLLEGDHSAAGVLYSYQALQGGLRKRRVGRRAGCPACEGRIHELSRARYGGAGCAA